jgi:hypothetical protein
MYNSLFSQLPFVTSILYCWCRAESSDEEANESGEELEFGAEVGGKGRRASKGGAKTPAKVRMQVLMCVYEAIFS